MEQTPGQYQYRCLPTTDYVRILILEPGSGNDTLAFSLKALPLDEAECQYEAISYVWGAGDETEGVICDGRRLLIKVSLAAALRTFRNPDSPRQLWADATCINQGDYEEKNDQVRRMAAIYQKARCVLCWFGEDDQNIATSCFDVILKSNQQISQQWQEGWTFRQGIDVIKLPDLSRNREEWQKVTYLLNLPWFERLWVVQEAGFARKCIAFWGKHHIEYEEIVELAIWFGYSSNSPQTRASFLPGRITTDVFLDIQCTYGNEPTWRHTLPLARALSQSYPTERIFYVDVLYSARFLKVTDPRETIYSSLGSPLALYQDGRLMISPHYDEPLNALHVRAACALFRNPREAPQVITRVTHSNVEDLNMYPTWVPRWKPFPDFGPRPVPLTWTGEYRRKPYHASGTNEAFEPRVETGDILTVDGIMIDEIQWVSALLKPENLRTDVALWDPCFRDSKVSIIETIWRYLLESSDQPPEESIKPFSLTFARGRPLRNNLDNFLAYCELLRSVVGSQGPSPFPSIQSGDGIAADAEFVFLQCQDRRFAYLTNGRLALVPLVTNASESCYIIRGMDVPVILRRTGHNTFNLVGECYVHGVMDGELFSSRSQEALDWESIRIE